MDFVKSIIYDELVKIVGVDNVSVSQVDKISYSRDAWPMVLMWIDLGRKLPTPDFIVHVENKEQIAKVLQLANTKNVPVIPFAGGAGACGQIIPIQGGIILDVKKMDKILRVDEKSATATVQPGILGEDLERELNKRGFTTGHFPASMFCSCLGGFVACRSAGSLSSKYGKMEDMVISMEVVLPNGEIMHQNHPQNLNRAQPKSAFHRIRGNARSNNRGNPEITSPTRGEAIPSIHNEGSTNRTGDHKRNL